MGLDPKVSAQGYGRENPYGASRRTCNLGINNDNNDKNKAELNFKSLPYCGMTLHPALPPHFELCAGTPSLGAFAALQDEGNGAAGPGWATTRQRTEPSHSSAGRGQGGLLPARPAPARREQPSPHVQLRSRTVRRAGGILDLEDRFGGQPLIKTFCMKLKKTHSVSV